MLTGDNQATARRIGAQLGGQTVIAEVLPGDKAAEIAGLQVTGLVLRPGIAARSMPGSSFIVAMNALGLKRLRLPGGAGAVRPDRGRGRPGRCQGRRAIAIPTSSHGKCLDGAVSAGRHASAAASRRPRRGCARDQSLTT